MVFEVCVVFEMIFDLFDISGRLWCEGVGEIRESLQWRFLKTITCWTQDVILMGCGQVGGCGDEGHPVWCLK